MYVIYIGKISKYFKPERGTWKGGPISAYLCIIVLEIVFQIIKETSNINGFIIFQKKFVYYWYYFFLKNTESFTNQLEIFKHFSYFSGLKSKKLKCEIVSIGVLKGVKVALYGMRYVHTWRYHKNIQKSLFIH